MGDREMRHRVARSGRWMAALVAMRIVMTCARADAWGPLGHELVTRAALGACRDLPQWFTDGAKALASLSNAPVRWRDLDTEVPALAAKRVDHYFDLDVWGRAALPADRWAYARRAAERGLDAAAIGALPYAIA